MTYKKLIRFLKDQTAAEKVRPPLQNMEKLGFTADRPINPSVRALQVFDLGENKKNIYKER